MSDELDGTYSMGFPGGILMKVNSQRPKLPSRFLSATHFWLVSWAYLSTMVKSVLEAVLCMTNLIDISISRVSQKTLPARTWAWVRCSPAQAFLVVAVDLARLLQLGHELVDALGVLFGFEVYDNGVGGHSGGDFVW